MREVVVGKIDVWDRRGGFAFAQTGDGTRFFLSALELSRAGILANALANRSCFLITPPGTNHLPLAGSFVLKPTSTH